MSTRSLLLWESLGFKKRIALALVMVALGSCVHAPGSAPDDANPLTASGSESSSPPPPPPPAPGDEALAQAESHARAAAEREYRQREMQAREQAEREARASMQGEMQARAMAERDAVAARAAAAATQSQGAGARGESASPGAPVASAATPELHEGALAEAQAAGAVPADTDEVDALLDRLRLGNIAFNAPKAINIEDTIRVRALVSPDEAAAALKTQIDAPGEQVVAPLKVSKLMEARLTGEGFRIVPISSAQQAVGSGVTTWEWEVTPEEVGRHRLTLTVDAFVRMDGQSVAKTLRTFDHPIDVQVTASQRIGGWMEEHGKWAWSTLLVPLWAWWTRRKKAKADSGTA